MAYCRWCGADTDNLPTLDCNASHKMSYYRAKRPKLWWNNKSKPTPNKDKDK